MRIFRECRERGARREREERPTLGRGRRTPFTSRIALRAIVAAAVAIGVGAVARPALAQRPVVLELFTSEGCSSCPPADALLRELSRSRTDVLPLGFHVTYWNYLGWRDPYSFDGATQRQRGYAASLPSEVYTPQLVVDGRADVIGSDKPSTLAAIRRAASAAGPDIPVRVRRDGGDVVIELGANAAVGVGAASVFLVGYDGEHTTPVGRGENGGHTLTEANIVRSFDKVAVWTGTTENLRRPVPAGEKIAVFVQAADGRILGAARESDHAS